MASDGCLEQKMTEMKMSVENYCTSESVNTCFVLNEKFDFAIDTSLPDDI
jgi:hypothetical protein